MSGAVKRLGAREAAFLAEMGIGPLWSLRAAPLPEEAEAPALAPEAALAEAAETGAEADAAPQAQPPAQARPLAPPPMPRQVAEPAARQAWAPPVADTAAEAAPAPIDVSGMDWAELRGAIAACRHCSACSEGRQPVPGAGATAARWLVAAGTASAADEQAGEPLTGEPGKLLDNMLQAVGMSRAADVYVTTLVKCRPANARGGERAPSPEEVAACRPFLERERELAGAALVLTLGQVAANGLRGQALSEPLAGSRGVAHRLGEVPMVATLHPAELLRRGADKALAWADLCLARRTGASSDGRAG